MAFCLASSAFILSRQRPRCLAARASMGEGKENDEDDKALEEYVWKMSEAVLDEVADLVPVVGPTKGMFNAAQEGRAWDYCRHVVMLLCDVSPFLLASEAARLAKVTSKVVPSWSGRARRVIHSERCLQRPRSSLRVLKWPKSSAHVFGISCTSSTKFLRDLKGSRLNNRGQSRHEKEAVEGKRYRQP